MKKDRIVVEGEVINSCHDEYTVRLGNDFICKGHLSGKLRKNHIWINPGDSVLIELSPLDLTHGRIVRRM